MTEPAAGSDAFALATRATADGTGFRITGQKTFVSNGPVADLIVAYAATDPARGYHGGVTAFLVPRDTAGVRVGPRVDKVSLRSCEMSDITFDDALVPGDAVLGKVGGGSTIFVQSMDWERSCLAALHIGTMERLLEESIAHARTRRLSGHAIAKFQAVSNRIVDMKVRLEAARLLTYRAASLLDSGRDIGIDASITKLFASESLLSTAQDAMRTLGGYGVLTQNETERALRDAFASTLYSGTSDVQRNIIARWLGL
jgi:alkylation response protein AidB-like acyl-CoA dehydrogenase